MVVSKEAKKGHCWPYLDDLTPSPKQDVFSFTHARIHTYARTCTHTCTYTCSLFAPPCYPGTPYLFFDPGFQCYTSEHYKLMLIAAAGLVVYIGEWLTVCVLCFNHHLALGKVEDVTAIQRLVVTLCAM